MADTELLPCPFCGSKAELHEEFRNAGHRAIECAECGANVGAVDLERGIEMWSRRAALASSAAEVDDEGLPPMAVCSHAFTHTLISERGSWCCDCGMKVFDGETTPGGQ